MARLPVFDPARTFDATSLSGSYQDVGGVMASGVIGFTIYNTSDADAQVSFNDGSTNGPIIPAASSFSSERFEQLKNKETGTYVIPEGAQIQVKQVTGAGTGGDIIVNIIRE